MELEKIHLVEGTKVKLWVIPTRRVGFIKDITDYEIRAKGPGRSVALYRVSYSPHRNGWYYFSVSSNPGKQVNTLSAPASLETTVAKVIVLAKQIVLTHYRGDAA